MRPITKIGLAAMLALATLLFVPGVAKKAEASGPYALDARSGYYIGASGNYYVRAKVYYWKGCYRYSYWRYNRVAYTPQVQYVTPRTEGWRTKLLEIAANRDKYEASQRSSSLEHSEWLQAVNALGLTGNFNWKNYGIAPQMASNSYASQQQYLQQPTQQGSTVYGYSTVADVYGDVDLGALYQQALRLGEQSQSYGAAAARDSKALIAQEGENRARVAIVLAEAQAVREKLDAARPTTQSHIRTHKFKIEVPGNGTQPTVTPLQSPPPAGGGGTSRAQVQPDSLARLIVSSCVKCHGGEKTEGKLDLRDLSKVTVNQGTAILQRIVHPDPEKRMPKDAPPLTVEERLLFFQAASPQPAAQE